MPKKKQVSPENRHRAQDLAYEAMMSTDGRQVMQLCAQALELDPRCTDAMLIITRAPLDHDETIESLKRIVKMAYEDLGGADYIEQNRGLFWDLLETRPYMRARAYLAIAYNNAGRLEEAIAECEELLELNPDDHQGMRHILLSAYLGRGDFPGLRAILPRFNVEYEAVFAWAHVLERYNAGDEAGARQALTVARNLNHYFEAYANGTQPLPPEQGGMYEKGAESEAEYICSMIGEAWLDQPGLVYWMLEQQSVNPYIAPRKIGRNDPCPCGSGKKYKHCCLGKPGAFAQSPAIIHPAPGQNSASGERFFHGFNEFVGDREIESEAELNTLLQEYQQQVNRQPVAGFHGLSPEQMERLLREPFDSPQVLEFTAVLPETPAGPLAELFALLAAAIGPDGLKPTATGNLPRKVVREIALAHLGEQGYTEHTRYRGINSEMDFPNLATVRFTAEIAGLIRKYKGRFILSRQCRKLLDKDGMRALYPLLFKTYAQNVEWSGLDTHPQLGFIQQSFAYSLYLLDRYGDKWRPASFYEDEFLRAFPTLVDEIGHTYYMTREEAIRLAYSTRCLDLFACFTGVVESSAEPMDRYTEDFVLRKTPLLSQVVRFHVS